MESKALVDRLKFERGLLQMKDLEQKEFIIMAELFLIILKEFLDVVKRMVVSKNGWLGFIHFLSPRKEGRKEGPRNDCMDFLRKTTTEHK